MQAQVAGAGCRRNTFPLAKLGSCLLVPAHLQWFEFSKGPQSTIAVVDTTPAATTTPALLSTLTAGASPYAVRLAVGPPTSTAPRQAIPYIM